MNNGVKYSTVEWTKSIPGAINLKFVSLSTSSIAAASVAQESKSLDQVGVLTFIHQSRRKGRLCVVKQKDDEVIVVESDSDGSDYFKKGFDLGSKGSR